MYAETQETMMALDAIPATSILSLLDTNKDQRSTFAMSVLEAMDDGAVDPLKIHCQVKKMMEIGEMFTDKKKYPTTATAYSKLILEAAERQDKTGKQFEMFDAKWQIKETGVSYDYSQCNDPLHAELTKQIEALKSGLKEREKFLQTIPAKGMTFVDEESGEATTLFPPSKSSTTSVSLTLK